jgi:hypothetical protein
MVQMSLTNLQLGLPDIYTQKVEGKDKDELRGSNNGWMSYMIDPDTNRKVPVGKSSSKRGDHDGDIIIPLLRKSVWLSFYLSVVCVQFSGHFCINFAVNEMKHGNDCLQ